MHIGLQRGAVAATGATIPLPWLPLRLLLLHCCRLLYQFCCHRCLLPLLKQWKQPREHDVLACSGAAIAAEVPADRVQRSWEGRGQGHHQDLGWVGYGPYPCHLIPGQGLPINLQHGGACWQKSAQKSMSFKIRVTTTGPFTQKLTTFWVSGQHCQELYGICN